MRAGPTRVEWGRRAHPIPEILIQPDSGPTPPFGSEASAERPKVDPVALGLLAVSLAWGALTIDRGWIPHDDGMLAQAAVRVLTGELPHRDFQDMYTGALSYLHALSFALFGVHLLAPRILLLVGFSGFLLLSYRLGRRFAGPKGAAAVVLLGAVWSLPNYPAAMPTWYNLFLAGLALWCLLRFADTQRLSWLVGAGAVCGLSIAIKIVGLYSLAAVLIGLVLVESQMRGSRPEDRAWPRAYAAIVAAGMLAYLALVVGLVRERMDPASVVHFVVPSAVVALVVVWRVVQAPSSAATAARLALLGRLVAAVLAGAALPIAALLVPYVVTGSVGALIDGVFLLPLRRPSLAATSSAPLPLATFGPTLVPLALAAVAAVGSGRVRTAALALLGVGLALVIALGGRGMVYPSVWGGLLLVPVLVTLATLSAARRTWSREPMSRRALDAGLAAIFLATFTLVQYPYSGPIYFFYLAPLVGIGALAGVSLAPSGWRLPSVLLLAFTLVFGARWVGTAELFATAQGRYAARPELERLQIDRGRIRMPAAERAEYEQLAGMVQELSAGTGVAFVTPDAPEAYFLTGLRNPTPVFYDFLDDPVGRTQRILETAERADVRVIVLNRAPSLSGPPPADLVTALEGRYPRAASVGRFVVRWR